MLFVHTGHANFTLINVQYLQNFVFLSGFIRKGFISQTSHFLQNHTFLWDNFSKRYILQAIEKQEKKPEKYIGIIAHEIVGFGSHKGNFQSCKFLTYSFAIH